MLSYPVADLLGRKNLCQQVVNAPEMKLETKEQEALVKGLRVTEPRGAEAGWWEPNLPRKLNVTIEEDCVLNSPQPDEQFA